MSIFDEALKLVTESPGDLVYFLVTLFALEAILAMALGEWLRGRRTSQVRRWLWAGIGLLLTRAVLMVGALLVWQDVLPAVTVMPPLERFCCSSDGRPCRYPTNTLLWQRHCW